MPIRFVRVLPASRPFGSGALPDGRVLKRKTRSLSVAFFGCLFERFILENEEK
jgi:hypothetical protein